MYNMNRFEDERYDPIESARLRAEDYPSAAELAEDDRTPIQRSHDFGGLVHPKDTGEVTPEWLKFALDFHARHGRSPSTDDFPF